MLPRLNNTYAAGSPMATALRAAPNRTPARPYGGAVAMARPRARPYGASAPVRARTQPLGYADPRRQQARALRAGRPSDFVPYREAPGSYEQFDWKKPGTGVQHVRRPGEGFQYMFGGRTPPESYKLTPQQYRAQGNKLLGQSAFQQAAATYGVTPAMLRDPKQVAQIDEDTGARILDDYYRMKQGKNQRPKRKFNVGSLIGFALPAAAGFFGGPAAAAAVGGATSAARGKNPILGAITSGVGAKYSPFKTG